MRDGATAADRQREYGARGRRYAFIWLAFLIYPLLDLFAPHLPAWRRAVGVAGLAAFLATYVWAWSGRLPGRPGRTGIAVAVTVALGLTLSAILGPAWLGLFVYAAALAGCLPSSRAAAASVASVTLISAISTWRLGGVGQGGLALVLTTGLTGTAMIGVAQLIHMALALRAARDDVARLAAADERLRIARDVHDLLGHSLSVIALKAELAQRLLPGDPVRAAEELVAVQAVARRSLAEVRTTVAGYRQPTLDETLAEARSGLEAAGIRCTFVHTAGPLPPTVDAALAWVVREAATNVLRHSRAATCQVRTWRSGGMVLLAVTDDGQGRERNGPARQGGAGIAGMRERLAAIGGTMALDAAPGRGLRLEARMPLPAAPLDDAGHDRVRVAPGAGQEADVGDPYPVG